MKTVILDFATLGSGLDVSVFEKFGTLVVYDTTKPEEAHARIADADAVIINKFRLNESNLKDTAVKLICIAATGYDNVDVTYCRNSGIAVANVAGYSTDCVAQITLSMALYLMTHIPEYTRFVRDGSYSKGNVANRLEPVYHEIAGKTWGIIGYGNIGGKVGEIAKAFGCNVIVFKRTPCENAKCVDIETLCRESDIISIHTPLNDGTREIINRERLGLMKKSAILINVARGKCVDESAVAEAVENGTIAGFGSDVYSVEPFPETHPFNKIKDFDNVCLTPHMAWGGIETRERLVTEMYENIRAFTENRLRNRVDLV